MPKHIKVYDYVEEVGVIKDYGLDTETCVDVVWRN